MQDWNAFIQYNLQDVRLVHEVHKRIVAQYRAEYLPRYGSAWENMMFHDMHHTKE